MKNKARISCYPNKLRAWAISFRFIVAIFIHLHLMPMAMHGLLAMMLMVSLEEELKLPSHMFSDLLLISYLIKILRQDLE